ncbi:MAG: Uma2 family endonuclease [Bacteroidota bacterium]
MPITVEKILAMPDARLLLQKVEVMLAAERTRRDAFREWLDEDKKAEFINGEIIMHSPVKKSHWQVSGYLSVLLNAYVGMHKLGIVAVEKALISLTRNDYEPDLSFFKNDKAASLHADQMIFPAPDFIVEILSKSTAKYDKGIKHKDYAAHGIREYWIIDPDQQMIEQYLLIGEDQKYMPASAYRINDDIKSAVIEGFETPVAALFEQEVNLKVLQKIVAPNPTPNP